MKRDKTPLTPGNAPAGGDKGHDAGREAGRIRIRRVDPAAMRRRGLFGGGCVSSLCNDECCVWGCDVDGATLGLIYEQRALIEPLVGARLEECFSTRLKKDNDYVGGSFRETSVRESDGLCAFHFRGARGCALFHLWASEGLPKRIIPTICRIYPLTWHRGALFVDSPIRKKCKCREKPAAGEKAPSLFETQAKDIAELFDIRPSTAHAGRRG